jgi:hypothetical protein
MRKDPFGEKTEFKIMLRNSREPGQTTEVDRVRGRGRAEKRVEILDSQLSPEQREAGWEHLLK